MPLAARIDGINYSDLHTQVKFVYRNWKGELADRRVTPIGLTYESNAYHDGFQWFLIAYDQDKKANRNFAIADIVSPITPVVKFDNRVKHDHNKKVLEGVPGANARPMDELMLEYEDEKLEETRKEEMRSLEYQNKTNRRR